jgi:hypothetical protein
MLDIIDGSCLWQCTSGPAPAPPAGGGGGLAFKPDEDAWARELARRIWQEQFLQDDEETVLLLM